MISPVIVAVPRFPTNIASPHKTICRIPYTQIGSDRGNPQSTCLSATRICGRRMRQTRSRSDSVAGCGVSRQDPRTACMQPVGSHRRADTIDEGARKRAEGLCIVKNSYVFVRRYGARRCRFGRKRGAMKKTKIHCTRGRWGLPGLLCGRFCPFAPEPRCGIGGQRTGRGSLARVTLPCPGSLPPASTTLLGALRPTPPRVDVTLG